MKIQINITNKAAYSLVLLLILAVGAGVYAYRSGSTPDILGHSDEEIEVTIGETTYTLNDYINNVLPNNWPAGNYCIVQAQNMACPAGFVATSPSFNPGAGWEFILGAGPPLQAGGVIQSNAANYFVDGGDLNFGVIPGQVWAFCCK